ncbi:S8 family peptidase [Microbacterium stercoris]|nr:S8 family serine peptidase [Microbacterium stercoris]
MFAAVLTSTQAAVAASGGSAPENLGGLPSGFASVDQSTLTGEGQMVVIIDGAFNPSHRMFASRVVEEACFGKFAEPLVFSDSTCSASSGPWSADPSVRFESGPGTSRYNVDCVDANGVVCNATHGSAVAGVAAGSPMERGGEIGTVAGVASGASLALLKVGTSVDWSVVGIYAALEYVRDVLSKKYSIAAVNISAAFDSVKIADTEPCPPVKFATLAAELKEKNIAVTVAAGNQGFSAATGKWACAPAAIAVGSTNVSDMNTLTDDYAPSNASARVQLLAPVGNTETGNQLWTAWSYRTPTETKHENNFSPVTGTSFASPQVAGAFAVLRQRFPDKSVDELTALLRRTGVNVADTRPGNAVVVMPRMWLAGAVADRDTRPVWDFTGDSRTDLPLLAANKEATLMLFSVKDDSTVDGSAPTTVSQSWTGHAITVPVFDYRVPSSNGFIASVASGSNLDLKYYAYDPATKKLDAGTTIATGVGADIVGGTYVRGLSTVGTGTGLILQRTNGALELRVRLDQTDSLTDPLDVLPADASVNSKLMSVADINADTMPDLIVADATSGMPRAYLGTRDPSAPFQATPRAITTVSYFAGRTQATIVADWALSEGKPAPYAWYSVPSNGNQVTIPMKPDGTLNHNMAATAYRWVTGVRLLLAARAD